MLVPLAMGGLPSLGRYTSVLFRVHLYLAARIRDAGRIALVTLFSMCQALVSMCQALVAALFFTWRPIY